MPRHVLERRKHMPILEPILQRRRLALEALHRSDRQLADQVGILAIRFLDPSPTGVAGNIHDGRERKLHSACANLPGNNRKDACQE